MFNICIFFILPLRKRRNIRPKVNTCGYLVFTVYLAYLKQELLHETGPNLNRYKVIYCFGI